MGDDETEPVPIPLDRGTRLLLKRLAAACGKDPVRLASELLRDVVADDAIEHHSGTMQ